MTFSKSVKIFAVIPAHCESKTIETVVKSVRSKISNVIVVDDGSSDKTSELARKSGAIVLSHVEKLGYEKTISDGFKEAVKRGADVILTYDADGETFPDEIEKIIGPIVSGEADISVGVRKVKSHFGEKVFSLYTKFFYGITDPLCGLKAYKKEVYKKVGYFDNLGGVGTQLMLEGSDEGFVVKQIGIRTKKREDKSRYYEKTLFANLKVLGALSKVILKRYKIGKLVNQ